MPRLGREYNAEEIEIVKEEMIRHKKVFRLQLALVSEKVTLSLMRKCGSFQPFQFDEVAEERKLNSRCGYPLCRNKPMENVPKLKFVDTNKRRIFDSEVASRFCGMKCLDSLELLKVQLPVSKNGKLDIPLVENMFVEDKPVEKELATEKEKTKSLQKKKKHEKKSIVMGNGIVETPYLPPQQHTFPVPGLETDSNNLEGYKQTEQENMRVQGNEEEGEQSPFFDDIEDEDAYNFFDVSDIKETLKEFELSPLMKLLNVFNQWTEPKVGEIEEYAATRQQIVSTNTSRGASAIEKHIEEYTKPLILAAIQPTLLKFNYSRPVPSFSPSEWQIVATVLYAAHLSKTDQPIEKLRAFSSDLLPEEFDSILNVAKKFAK